MRQLSRKIQLLCELLGVGLAALGVFAAGGVFGLISSPMPTAGLEMPLFSGSFSPTLLSSFGRKLLLAAPMGSMVFLGNRDVSSTRRAWRAWRVPRAPHRRWVGGQRNRTRTRFTYPEVVERRECALFNSNSTMLVIIRSLRTRSTSSKPPRGGAYRSHSLVSVICIDRPRAWPSAPACGVPPAGLSLRRRWGTFVPRPAHGHTLTLSRLAAGRARRRGPRRW